MKKYTREIKDFAAKRAEGAGLVKDKMTQAYVGLQAQRAAAKAEAEQKAAVKQFEKSGKHKQTAAAGAFLHGQLKHDETVKKAVLATRWAKTEVERLADEISATRDALTTLEKQKQTADLKLKRCMEDEQKVKAGTVQRRESDVSEREGSRQSGGRERSNSGGVKQAPMFAYENSVPPPIPVRQHISSERKSAPPPVPKKLGDLGKVYTYEGERVFSFADAPDDMFPVKSETATKVVLDTDQGDYAIYKNVDNSWEHRERSRSGSSPRHGGSGDYGDDVL
jgi:hypothetical protein